MGLSLEDAIKLSEQYQFLVGTTVDSSGDSFVENVAVIPCDDANRYRFFLYYLLFDGNARTALSQDYDCRLFDVAIICRDKQGGLSHQLLNSWLAAGEVFSPKPINASAYSGEIFL